MSLKRFLALDVVEKVGQTVKLCGWAQTVRDHGSLIFIDLRDWSGVVQVVVDEKDKKNFDIAKSVGSEYVLSLEGKVVERAKKLQNEKIPTGKIEVKVSKIEILNKSKTPPFPLSDDGRDIDEFVRLKYRYIDVRRKRVRDLIEKRHKLINFVTQWFSDNDFVQVQTPLLTVSSPEGARDFLVPSRLYPGHFYALPQAPQQYKQLLMVGGLNRYFQIAPCFRDEDPRTDRHYGSFYQVDAELSFVTQDEIFESVEPFFKDVFEEFTNKKLKEFPIPRIPYREIVETYGSDKADLRFDMKLVDLTEFFKSSPIDIFKEIELAKAILVDKEFSRKEIEIWTENMQKQGAKGLSWFKCTDCVFEGPLVKFFNKRVQSKMKTLFQKNGYTFKGTQTILAVGGKKKDVNEQMGWLRSKMGDLLGLKKDDEVALAWVVDFDMFQWDEDRKRWDFMHNPFSMPTGGLEALKSKDPGEIKALQYDLIGNGYELLSGSIRNHHPETFLEAFKICGYTEAETRAKFGHMLTAFEYGAPPHGGFALGLDRFSMILFDENNIREIYAFPMSGGQEIMTESPKPVSADVLNELGLKLKN